MKLTTLKINAAAANDGDWVDGIEGFGDFAVRISSLDARRTAAYQSDLFRKIIGKKASRKEKGIPPEVLDYVLAKTLVDCCVSDWRNWQDDQGADVAYSKTALEDLLLVDGPIKAGEKEYSTPDGKHFNFEMVDVLNGLVWASEAVKDNAEDEAAEKNGSANGSAGTAPAATSRKKS